jgi:murein DD-endopeptidase MepM/ murein hydrolase activator NlpD
MSTNDTGYFQINDIVLNIPPSSIRVEEQPFNNQWQTLRTRGSEKIKSGRALTSVEVNAIFTTDVDAAENNGFDYLRVLVAQLRVVPFCYIKNYYLSNVLNAGAIEEPIILALKKMVISKDARFVNAINVSFRFLVFNYKPYMPYWQYRSDVFSQLASSGPQTSLAWRLMYEAELARGHYVPLENGMLNGALALGAWEYMASAEIGQGSQFSSEVEAVDSYMKLQRDVREELEQQQNSGDGEFPARQVLSSSILSSIESFFGNATSMGVNIFSNTQSSTPRNDVVSAGGLLWEPMAYTGPDKIKKYMTYNGRLLLRRRVTLYSNKREDIIVTGVEVVIEHNLAIIPIIGQARPTFQHISSPDATVSIQLMVTSDEALQAISNFERIETVGEINFRNIPPDQKRIKVVNDILNLCGIHEVVISQYGCQTVPGQIGVSAVSLILMDDSYDQKTSSFKNETAFASADLRTRIAETALRSIRFSAGAYVCSIPSSDFRQARFRSFCTEYASILSALYQELSRGISSGANGALSEVLSIKDEVIPGISKVQTDLASFHRSAVSDVLTGSAGAVDAVKSAEIYDNITRLQRELGAGNWALDGELETNIEDYSAYLAGGSPNRSARSPDWYKENTQKLIVARDNILRLQREMKSDNSAALRAELESNLLDYRAYMMGCYPNHQANSVAPISDSQMSDLRAAADDRIANDSYYRNKRLEELQRERIANVSTIDTSFLGLRSRYQLLIQSAEEYKLTKQMEGGFENTDYASPLKLYSAAVSAGALISIPVALGAGPVGLIGLSASLGTAYLLNRAVSADFDLAGIVRKYSGQIQRLFDRWQSLGILQEEAFRNLTREIMAGLNNVNSSNVAYPDFPMEEIVSLLGQANVELKEFLFARWRKMGLMSKGIGPAILINPDFYLMNPLADEAGSIFKSEAIETVKKTASEGLKNYSINIKENLIVGAVTDKEKRRKEVLGEESRESFASLKRVLKIATSPVIEEMESQSKDYTPYDLTESTEYSNALVSAEAEGLTIDFSAMKGVPEDSKGLATTSERPAVSLRRGDRAPENAIVHRAGGQAILDEQPGSKWQSLNTPWQPQVRSVSTGGPSSWVWPVNTSKFVVTSPFGFRKDPVASKRGESKQSFHRGIDFAYKGCKGDIIFAAADGWVTKVELGTEPEIIPGKSPKYGKGSLIEISHGAGWKSRYGHLNNDARLYNAFAKFTRGGQFFVKAGEVIASVGNTGYTTGAHLHFEIHKGANNPVDPFSVLSGEFAPRAPISADSVQGETLLQRMIGSFEEELVSGGGGTGLIRAYPTFKLYFIERDEGVERKQFGLDDLFSYAAIKEIQVINNKHVPAATVQIMLTNVSGTLSNRRYKNKVNPETGQVEERTGAVGVEDARSLQNTNTKEENVLISLLLQPGVDIQLKLGYNNNPQLLTPVLNGKIVEVQFSETDDVVMIVAQSYGTELAQVFLGVEEPEKISSGDTKYIIEQMLAKPELVHFGRWEPESKVQGEFYDLLSDKFHFRADPKDINNFGPGGDRAFNLYKSAQPYYLLRTTVWDVLNEMTLRHPGNVVVPLPYEGEWGPRMTLYFGLPNQMYFARDPNKQEHDFVSNLTKLAEEISSSPNIDEMTVLYDRLAYGGAELDIETLRDKLESTPGKTNRKNFLHAAKRSLAEKTGIVKPLQAHHVVTSDMHIIANNISSTAKNSFNSVCLEYSEDISDLKDSVEDDEKLANRLPTSDSTILKMKYDVDLPDEEKREMFAKFLNCVTEEQAKRYGVSLLWQALKKTYRGSLVIMGNASIKPYDIVYICDTYNEMYGQIEVEQVVHKFSEQTGFITEIKPEAVIHINQSATATTDEVMGALALQAVRSMDSETANIVAMNTVELFSEISALSERIDSVNPLKLEGYRNFSSNFTGNLTSMMASAPLWLAKKYFSRSQYNHPFRFEPILYRGEPLLHGITHKNAKKGAWYALGEYYDEAKLGLEAKMAEVCDKYSPANFWSPTGSFWSYAMDTEGYVGPEGEK